MKDYITMNIFTILYEQLIFEAIKAKQPNEAILNRLAFEYFPNTTYCTKTTGYILTDGTCLDFSGGGYDRGLDHREINEIFLKNFPRFKTPYMKRAIGSGSGYMLAFMDIAKAMRFGASRNAIFINFIHNPNKLQSRKLVTYINYLLNRYQSCEITIEKFNNNYETLKHAELREDDLYNFENGIEYDFPNFLENF